MRRAGLASILTFAAFASAGSVNGQGMTPEQYQQGFTEAARCYVVLANASEDRRQHGDATLAAYFDAKAHKAFDNAYSAARLRGRTQEEANADIEAFQQSELPKVVRDPTYNRTAAQRCKAIGYL